MPWSENQLEKHSATIMPLSLFSDAIRNKEKKEIVEKLKSYEDSSSFSSRQGTGFGRLNFPTLNKDVGGLNYPTALVKILENSFQFCD